MLLKLRLRRHAVIFPTSDDIWLADQKQRTNPEFYRANLLMMEIPQIKIRCIYHLLKCRGVRRVLRASRSDNFKNIHTIEFNDKEIVMHINYKIIAHK